MNTVPLALYLYLIISTLMITYQVGVVSIDRYKDMKSNPATMTRPFGNVVTDVIGYLLLTFLGLAFIASMQPLYGTTPLWIGVGVNIAICALLFWSYRKG